MQGQILDRYDKAIEVFMGKRGTGEACSFPFEELVEHFDNTDDVVEEVIFLWGENGFDNSIISSTLRLWARTPHLKKSHKAYPYLLWRNLIKKHSCKTKGTSPYKEGIKEILENTAPKGYEYMCAELVIDFLKNGNYQKQLTYLRDLLTEIIQKELPAQINEKDVVLSKLKVCVLREALSFTDDDLPTQNLPGFV